MEAIANMIRVLVTLVVIGVLIALFVVPIVIAVHAGVSTTLMIDIVVGELIVLGIICYVLLAMFARGMSQ